MPTEHDPFAPHDAADTPPPPAKKTAARKPRKTAAKKTAAKKTAAKTAVPAKTAMVPATTDTKAE